MTSKKAGKLLGKITKAYIYKNLFQTAAKFVAHQLKQIDYEKVADSRYFDKKFLLKKAGLKQRAPAKAAFGSLSLLVLGAAAGAVAGLLLAPKTGAELRPMLKDKAMSFINEHAESTQAPATA